MTPDFLATMAGTKCRMTFATPLILTSISWLNSRAGNYHSDKLHVVERWTASSPNTLNYEATIEDPNVFTRPWKVSFPLYRRVEKNAQLLEYKCVEFVEELMYGHLRKQPSR